jgi:hypothetical protein
VEGLAEVFRRIFPDAVMEYAEMGRTIYEALLEVEEGRRRSKTTCRDPGVAANA